MIPVSISIERYGCLFVLIFLVIYPATRFRTRLLSIDAEDASCCLFASKLFEKFSFCVERSAVPMVLIYDGFIPMKYSSKFYTYNAVRQHNNIASDICRIFTEQVDLC